MAWTAPSTWVAAAVLTAAQLNQQLRDNMLSLSTWTAYTPTWANTTLGTTGLVNSAKYIVAGKVVTVKFQLTFGTGGSFTGVPSMSLPAGLAPASSAICGLGAAIADDTSAGAAARRSITVYQNSVSAVVAFLANGDDAGTKIVTTGTPFTWAAGDTLAGTFTYEAA